VFDGHYPILIVPRHIGMASIKQVLENLTNYSVGRQLHIIQNTQ